MPNASGKVLGTTSASHTRQHVGELLVVEPAGEHDPLAQSCRRQVGRRRVRQRFDEREQVAQRPQVGAPASASRALPARGDLQRPSRSPRAERRAQALERLP